VISLLNFPIGTAIGVYGLWVLLTRNGEVVYRRSAVLPAQP
jgi:hypothetical protein